MGRKVRSYIHFSRPHQDPIRGTTRQYQYAYVCTLNVLASQPQRPELPWHRFATEPVTDPLQQGVTIFQKVRPVP